MRNVRRWVGSAVLAAAAAGSQQAGGQDVAAQVAEAPVVRGPEYRGVVTYHGLPVPGATVTLTQGAKKSTSVTDSQGFYVIAGLTNGPATVSVASTGFSAPEQPVTIAADTPLGRTELKLMTLDEMRTALKPVMSAPYTEVQTRSEVARTGEAPKPKDGAAPPAPVPQEIQEKAAEGLLVNGSVNNAATSPFSLQARFGNTASGKSLYNWALNVRVDNSALDARSYSIAGIDTTKPHTNALTGGAAFDGPIKIPHVLRNGPDLYVGYQRTENSTAVTTPGLVPDQFVRAGDFSHGTTVIYNPATGMPYAGNQVPVSPQAAALLALYPLPNVVGNPLYNYQLALVSDVHQDSLNSNVSKTIGRKNQITGNFGAQSSRTSTTNLFGFTDATSGLGMNANINWSHTFNVHFRQNAGYTFSRQSSRLTPYWQNRKNVSGDAGITGNDQDAQFWGPPTLQFSGGLSGLYDGAASFTRNATQALSYTLRWNHSPHNVTVGGDFKRAQFNYLTQANPRGTFTFTGAATTGAGAGTGTTGSDVADFLIGTPDASALSFGNADKYLRQNIADAYLTDDWRVNPQLTLNLGVRWEYGSPVSEIKNRLVNLDVGTNFATIAPVFAFSPRGTLTGTGYTNALLDADRSGFEPRLGLSWRPLPGSSLVVSAGYGVNYDSSVYQGIALALAQQAPLPGTKSLNVQNGPGCNLSLAVGFINCATTTPEIFGVDKNFRVGYVQTWNLKAQRDLPGSLQAVVTYLGNKGTRGVQEYLPNTNAPGALNPCPLCPTGFEYISSTGNSTRESLQVQLRRRLKSGLTAQVLYTWSKSIDDDSSLGGGGAATQGSARLAQNWRNLSGERGLSNFDQRHVVNFTAQYTTGMGKGGGTLLTGWRGKLYKEWTVQAQALEGTGLPETPYVAAVLISGYSSFVRPDVTGAPVQASGAGQRYVNPGAFKAPATGMFGNARRNSITGPNQFSLNMALLRTFRLPHKLNLDAQISAANALNHVSYTSYVTNINGTQFGLPAAANTMRTVQTSLRLRF